MVTERTLFFRFLSLLNIETLLPIYPSLHDSPMSASPWTAGEHFLQLQRNYVQGLISLAKIPLKLNYDSSDSSGVTNTASGVLIDSKAHSQVGSTTIWIITMVEYSSDVTEMTASRGLSNPMSYRTNA